MFGDLLVSRKKDTGVKSIASVRVCVSSKRLFHCQKSTFSSSYIVFRKLCSADESLTFQFGKAENGIAPLDM